MYDFLRPNLWVTTVPLYFVFLFTIIRSVRISLAYPIEHKRIHFFEEAFYYIQR